MTNSPPQHLSKPSQTLYSRIATDYGLWGDDAAEAILRLCCESMDRCENARQQVEREGATVTDRFGQVRVHPAVQIERDSRLAAVRCLRELGLSPDPAAPNNFRPPPKPRR